MLFSELALLVKGSVNLFLSAHLKHSGENDQRETSKEKCDGEKDGFKGLARLFVSSP